MYTVKQLHHSEVVTALVLSTQKCLETPNPKQLYSSAIGCSGTQLVSVKWLQLHFAPVVQVLGQTTLLFATGCCAAWSPSTAMAVEQEDTIYENSQIVAGTTSNQLSADNNGPSNVPALTRKLSSDLAACSADVAHVLLDVALARLLCNLDLAGRCLECLVSLRVDVHCLVGSVINIPAKQERVRGERTGFSMHQNVLWIDESIPDYG